jgi:conserved oligomeric Golgi complex subunit 5
VNKLQRLQETSDVLRRTSRFFVLARRLEIQMSEVEGKTQPSTNGDDASAAGPLSAHDSTALTSTLEPESEKERAIAKAALSIAEIGKGDHL